MSRRKQLHPKPIKDCGKDDVEQVCRSHNLPGHILHLQELTDDPDLDYSVHSISTILQGSQFGPFTCAILNAIDEGHNEEGLCIAEFPVSSSPEAKVCLSIESPSGHWLRLLRKSADLQNSNIKLCIEDKCTLWCEVLKNIRPDEELVATLLQDDKMPSSSSSSSSSPPPPPSSSSSSLPALSILPSVSSSIKVEAMEIDRSPGPSTAGRTGTEEEEEEGDGEPDNAAFLPSMVPNAAAAAAAAAASVGSVQWDSLPSLLKHRGGERRSSVVHPSSFETAETEAERQRPTFSLIHVCMFCGVRFSNPRTLQAHIANYCSKKPTENRILLPPNPSSLPFTSPPAADIGGSAWHHHSSSPNHSGVGNSQKRSFEDEEAAVRAAPKLLCKTEDVSDSMERDERSAEEREVKSARDASGNSVRSLSPVLSSLRNDSNSGDAVFPCPHCPYSFESSLLLAHHLRIHYMTPTETGTGTERQALGSNEYVCSNCNIKFSSLNTYKGHREFYCQKRSRSNSKAKSAASPEPTSSENSLPISPFCPFPSSRMPMFSPGSTVFPPPIFPPPCLQPTNGLYVSQAQAVFLAAAPFLGSSNMPSMTFNVPIVVQPIAPLVTNGMLQTGDYHMNDVEKIPAIKQEGATATKKLKSSSETSEEKPLDLSTRKSSPIVKERSHHYHGKKEKSPVPKQALSDSEQMSNGSSNFGNSSTLSIFSDGIKVCSPNYLSDSVHPVPPPSLLSSPFAIPNMLPVVGSSLSPRASDMALAPGMVPPSISKCVDCNIVFYKHENYIAHKEHYCAGRLSKLQTAAAAASGFGRRPSIQSLGSIGPDSRGLMSNAGGLAQSPSMKATIDPVSGGSGVALPSEASGSLIKPSSQSPELVATIDQGMLQYYCIPCKIKFSSLDTLKAHKKFYCPSKSTSLTEEQTAVAKTEEICNGSRARDSNDAVMLACSSCGNTFASAQLLKLHYCTGTMVHYPLFHCPYCDYIAQSDSRLVDHIKAHAPSKAYKCVLCGYRGNTVRGMRMHGKMHNDAGETFTDDSMIEYEEPPMIPKRLRSSGEGTFGEMEVDLIRLKNEPYKRRRSRKAYEKSEFCNGPAPTRCVECKEMFSDPDLYQAHMQTHVAEKIRAWKSFDLNPNSTADLLQLQAKLYPGSVKHLNQTAFKKCCSDVDQKQNHTIVKDLRSTSSPSPSTRPNKEDAEIRALDVVDNAGSEEQEDVNVVDTSCGATENEEAADGERRAPQTTNNNHKDSNDANFTALPTVKEEIVDIELDSSEDVIKSTSDEEDIGDPGPSLPSARTNGKTECKSSSELTDNGNLEKYCKQCNITFMYTSTFIAHKKYYCSSHTAERSAGSTVA